MAIFNSYVKLPEGNILVHPKIAIHSWEKMDGKTIQFSVGLACGGQGIAAGQLRPNQ